MGTFLSKALRKTTDAVTNASGGRALADYVGTKIAQKQNMRNQTIINGDCLENLHLIPNDAIIVTDPPFNIGYHYNSYNDNLGADERVE